MMGLNIKIFGDKELTKAFNGEPQAFNDSFTDALDKLLWRIAGKAKDYSPVKTGTLRRSIHKEGPTTRNKRIEGVVGTNVFYAPFQEFGTSRGVTAKLYMTRGLEDAKSVAPAILKDALKDVTVQLAK